MTIGSDGSLYLTGRTSGSLEGTNIGQLDAWVAKFDSSGNEEWTKQLGTTEDDESYAVTVDGSGNVYISGQTKGSLAGAREADGDAWAAMYDSSGNLQWQTQLGTTAADTATSIAVDNEGRVYLSGQTHGWLGETYQGDINDWTGDLDARYAARIGNKSGLGGTYYGNGDAWVAQLDANNNGSINWKRLLGTESADGSTGIFADSLGNAYLTGFTQGKLVSDEQAGSDDIFLAKYDENGALLWKKQMGSEGEDVASDIVVGGTGVYLTGYTSADLESANKGGKDVWAIKLS